jgi:hypothetical protein
LVSQVSPGVFYYWVTATSSSTGTFEIKQDITTGNFDSNFFAQASGSFVYTTGCTKVSATITTSGGITSISGLTANTMYVIGIKYDATSVKGLAAPSLGTTVHYTFTLAGLPSSSQGLDLKLKGT